MFELFYIIADHKNETLFQILLQRYLLRKCAESFSISKVRWTRERTRLECNDFNWGQNLDSRSIL